MWSVLNVDVKEFFDVLIGQFSSELLQSINKRISKFNQLNTTESMLTHSKPNSINKLSTLTLDIGKTPPTLRLIIFLLIKQSWLALEC